MSMGFFFVEDERLELESRVENLQWVQLVRNQWFLTNEK